MPLHTPQTACDRTAQGSDPSVAAVDQAGEDHLRARAHDRGLALELHDHPLEVLRVTRADADDAVRVAGDRPRLHDLGVWAQRVADLVEADPRRVEQLDE